MLEKITPNTNSPSGTVSKDPIALLKVGFAKTQECQGENRRSILKNILSALNTQKKIPISERLHELNETFLDILQNDPSQENRSNAAGILGHSATQELVPGLLAMARTELDMKVKKSLLNALGKIGERFGGEEIQDLLIENAKEKSNSVEIRNSAIFALQYFPDQKTLDCIITIDKENNTNLRTCMTGDKVYEKVTGKSYDETYRSYIASL